MFTKIFSKKSFLSLATVVTALTMALSFVAFSPATAVFADNGTSPAAPGKQANLASQRLERAYQREQDALEKQQENLDKADQGITRAQDLIDKAKGQGKDVTALETALATFKSQVAAAKVSHQNAQDILAAHNGFDAGGKVTNLDDARQTVQSARQSMLDAHRLLRQALVDLRRALQTWRREHKPAPSGTAGSSS